MAHGENSGGRRTRNSKKDHALTIEDFMTQDAITDFDIQALVDNSDDLAAEERRGLFDRIRHDKISGNRYDELTRQQELLQAWWASRQSFH